MKDEEKQRKFHEALLKMLYPPPSSTPPDDQEGNEKEEEKNLIEPSNDLPGDALENEEDCSLLSTSDDNECENGSTEKLTRAQRKRLRKRKLKQQRRKIIGPLLPGSNDDSDHGSAEVVGNVPEAVRQNATSNVSGGPASCSKKNKLKQRRKSKKLAVAKMTSSSIESSTSNQNQDLKMGTDDRTDS